MHHTGSDQPANAETQTRRSLLTKVGVGGAVIWAAPTVLSFTSNASASGAPSAILLVTVQNSPNATCDDPNNVSFVITTVVTPDLIGQHLAYLFTFPGLVDDLCQYAQPEITSTTMDFTFGFQGFNTLEIGVAVRVIGNSDCSVTLASYPPVPSPCGPLPSAIGMAAGSAGAPATRGTITLLG